MLHAVHLSVLIGPSVPVPAPAPLLEALQSVEITHTDEGRSGFQLALSVGRGAAGELREFALLNGPLLRPFNRVLLAVSFGPVARVLFDGFITDRQLVPGARGASLSITGEDVSVVMDREERTEVYQGQSEAAIATTLILRYARYGLVPRVMPPPTRSTPGPTEQTSSQHGTDLAYLRETARQFGFVFYVIPGPVPLANTAYWGPRVRSGPPQRALSVDLGTATNVTSLNFRYNALAATRATAYVIDERSDRPLAVDSLDVSLPPLSASPAWREERQRRTLVLSPGQSIARAQATAQGAADAAADAVTAEGELDALRYGEVLEARALVGVRGAGLSNDGLYYVKRVSHSIARGSYKQRFTLARDGLGPLSPVVRP